jgi:hypothetical protein
MTSELCCRPFFIDISLTDTKTTFMENETKKRGIPFREFLEKSVNLLTVFGILNALFIFSLTFKNSGAYQFLGVAFFIMSILVWIEIILSIFEATDDTWRYTLLYFLFCSVGVGLVWLFIELFRVYVAAGLFFALIFLIIAAINVPAIWIGRKLTAKMKEKRRRNILTIVLLISILLTGVFFSLTGKYVRPVITPIFEKVVGDTTIVNHLK